MKNDPRFKNQEYRKEQVEGHLQGAKKKLQVAKKISEDDVEASYQLAYEAMLKASLALIFRNGFRPRSQPGHHIAIIEKAEEILGSEVADMTKVFDEMRRNRNSSLYDAEGIISDQELRDALRIAERYLKLIIKKINE